MTAASSSGVIFPLTSASIPSLAKTSRPTFCKLARARIFIPEFSFCQYLRCEDFHRGGRHNRQRAGRSRGEAMGRVMPFPSKHLRESGGKANNHYQRRGGKGTAGGARFQEKNGGGGFVPPCPGSPGPFGAGPSFTRKRRCYHTSASFNNLF